MICFFILLSFSARVHVCESHSFQLGVLIRRCGAEFHDVEMLAKVEMFCQRIHATSNALRPRIGSTVRKDHEMWKIPIDSQRQHISTWTNPDRLHGYANASMPQLKILHFYTIFFMIPFCIEILIGSKQGLHYIGCRFIFNFAIFCKVIFLCCILFGHRCGFCSIIFRSFESVQFVFIL